MKWLNTLEPIPKCVILSFVVFFAGVGLVALWKWAWMIRFVGWREWLRGVLQVEAGTWWLVALLTVVGIVCGGAYWLGVADLW